MKNKKVYLEIIRIIAIFLVLYCHTGKDAVLRLMGAGSQASFAIGVFMRVLSFTCNMLFFMISGALLLGKEEPISKVLKNRVLKMVAVIVIFSFQQMLWECFYLKTEVFDLVNFFKGIYAEPYITQYWFLYEYLGFLVMLPLLRLLVKQMESRHYLYLLGAVLLWQGGLPFFEKALGLENFGVELPMFASAWIYALLGYFIEQVYWEKIYSKKALLWVNVAGAAAFAAHGLLTADTYAKYIITEQNMGLLMVIAVVLFVDVKALCMRFRLPKNVSAVLLFIGNGVFGVYLLEPQVRGMYHFIYEALVPGVTWIGATVVWLGAALLTGSLIMNGLKRIPGVRRLF